MYHIKRDGRMLCEINNKNASWFIKWMKQKRELSHISFKEAIFRKSLNGCCKDCTIKFFEKLNRLPPIQTD